ncbi:MAG TPA: DUF2807 domain-containing protein [Mucilaginibacter sp.]|jgi:hypothetical protein|nr:DUF2807 domain-containing protein [Mucilaginibacter sp.]
MKTSIVTIAIALSTVFGISKSGFAATRTTEEATTLTEVSRISKIEVHGNVELFVSDGTTDEVKVYNHYYAESALVQNENGVLRISSYTDQKLVVWVKASTLREMSLYDNAEVKSFGSFSAIELDVKLHNNASAQLKMDAYTANITLNDHAKADLTGSITEGTINYDQSSYLNLTNLETGHLTKTVNFDTKIKCAAEYATL